MRRERLKLINRSAVFVFAISITIGLVIPIAFLREPSPFVFPALPEIEEVGAELASVECDAYMHQHFQRASYNVYGQSSVEVGEALKRKLVAPKWRFIGEISGKSSAFVAIEGDTVMVTPNGPRCCKVDVLSGFSPFRTWILHLRRAGFVGRE